MELSEHTGVIDLGEHTIQVTIGIDDIEVHLTADNAEVGKWSHNECRIVSGGPGTFLIEAENDSLPFIPRDPAGFARTLVATLPATRGVQTDKLVVAPPKPVTLALFYALSATTAGLGVWAIWNMIF